MVMLLNDWLISTCCYLVPKGYDIAKLSNSGVEGAF